MKAEDGALAVVQRDCTPVAHGSNFPFIGPPGATPDCLFGWPGSNFLFGGLPGAAGTPDAVANAPNDVAAWFHNHPIDGGGANIDQENQQPSPPDWQAMHQLQDHINSLTKAYILGPDNKLRSFWLEHSPGNIVK